MYIMANTRGTLRPIITIWLLDHCAKREGGGDMYTLMLVHWKILEISKIIPFLVKPKLNKRTI